MKLWAWIVLGGPFIAAIVMLTGCSPFNVKSPDVDTDYLAWLKSKSEAKAETKSETHNDAVKIKLDTTRPAVPPNADNAPLPPVKPAKVTVIIEGEATAEVEQTSTGSSASTETSTATLTETKTESRTSTNGGDAGGSDVPKGAGWGFKVWGGIILILGVVGVIVLLKFSMGSLCWMGWIVAAAGAVMMGVGLFLDAAESIPWGWYVAGLAVAGAAVALVLALKYKKYLIDLAATVKAQGADSVVQANKALMPEREKKELGRVLSRAGVNAEDKTTPEAKA
jgi:hypothetical protein